MPSPGAGIKIKTNTYIQQIISKGLPLLFNFTSEWAIRRVQVNQDSLKLNGTHLLLAYADDVNILGGSMRSVKENAEALVVAATVIGLEVNADKTKYMVMSRDQNAGRTHSMKTDNSSFERVDEFKYLGTTLTNQNSIQEGSQGMLAIIRCRIVFQFAIQKFKD
jgi:hypothetical protein